MPTLRFLIRVVFSDHANEGGPRVDRSLYLTNIKASVIGSFGNVDANPSPADVAKTEAKFNKHGNTMAFHGYDGADHAFQSFTNPDRYHEVAATDAWDRTL